MSSRIGAVIDRRGNRRMVAAVAVTVGVAFVFVAAGGYCLVMLMLGMVLLDVGNRVCLIANQSRIYTLRPDARSRLNTVFFVWCFLGAAAGAALGGYSAHRGGWLGLAAIGMTFALAAAAINLLAYRESNTASEPVRREEPYP
ncbi:MFS transporter [Burkholderia cepacia]|uniref:MFS transporter n=1 Tax=Burkholderia cepacia TaxID=292 RepID=UPI00158C73FB|nr:MFS transporter [Burkholderia cepacia]